MTQFNIITSDKQFGTIAQQFKVGMGKANERLQALIEYGIARIPETNDTSHLSQALNIAIGVKSLPTKQIKAYIQAHVNVKWQKTTDGTYKFKRDGKEWDIKEVSVPFWESKELAKAQAQADLLDPIAEVKRLFGMLTRAKNDGKIPEDRVHFLDDLVSRTRDILDNVDELSKAELRKLAQVKPEVTA